VLRGKHCHLLNDILKVNAEDASDTLVPLYLTARVTRNKNEALMFTAVINLMFCVVLPCFSFRVNSAHSVYTQHGTKQTSTECYCRLWIVSDIQRKVSTGGQLV